MTEENARHGDAGTPGVPPADGPGDPSTSTVPSMPPKPSTPPTSGIPVVPPASSAAATRQPEPPATPASPVRPSVPPVSGDHTRTSSAFPGLRKTAGSLATSAARQFSANAALLGPWARRQSLPRIGAAVVALVVVVGLLVWLLPSTLAGPKPAAEGSLAPAAASSSASPSRGALPLEDVSPLDFQLNDCFKDFDPDAPQSTVVDCTSGHSAQLVAIARYDKADAYPGRDPLKQRARSACKSAPLAEKSGSYDLSYKLAYPSASSWEKGDRRVDCYVIANAGNVIMDSLRP
ncbi:septum formation family protein [Arthrobacter sp. UYCu712]|uniref:septum formation family protein n=1 Tax=Arthrobacter sp. UYCu712 TaxID=3156340 RepID=UPI00339A1FB9